MRNANIMTNKLLLKFFGFRDNDAKVTFMLARYREKQRTEISSAMSKAVPLQAWSGPEGSRKLRFPNFMTTAQDGGKVVSPTHRPPLPPGNTPGTHFC
jgi:hypothetical protein